MTQYVINIGAIPNDGTGDPLRTAFNETNLNFDQVFAAGPVLSNVRIANNTILTTTTNGNLILAPNGIGRIQANATIVPSVANVRDLGSSTQRWSTVYTQYLDVSANLNITGNIIYNGDLNVDGNLTVQGNIIQVGNIVTDSKTIQLANTAGTANAANGSGITVGANDDIATFLYNSNANSWTTNIGLQITSSGNTWRFNNNFLTAPSGASWQSVPSTLDEYITSANNGYIDLQSRLAGNMASAVHLEHGLVQIIANTGDNQTWTFDSAGNLTLPGNTFTVNYANGTAVALGSTSSYGNANVATFLSNFGSNTISTTGAVNTGTLSITGNITANSAGNVWTISNDTLTFPSNASWRSDKVTLDEYISSATDGYLNLQTYDNTSNVATELHMEHGVVQINIYNGSSKTWNFNEDGSTVFPGDLLPTANLGGSLGNSTLWWSNLWVANNTIYIGGVALGMTAGNVLTVNGNAVLQNGSDSTISTTGNITTGNVLTGGVVSAAGNVRGANFNTVGLISATGNITAGNIGITGGSLTWSNASIVQTSASDVSITGDGQVTVRSLGGTYQWTFDSNGNLTAPANVSATGNITGGNVLTGGLISATSTIMSAANVTGGNILTGGLVSASGNITGGNVSTGVITLTNGAVIKDNAGDSVAFGQSAGETSQGNSSVALGHNAGATGQGTFAVAIGRNAGQNTQGGGTVAVGVSAGGETQGNNAIAIGSSAGFTGQGSYAVGIGIGAGQTNQGVDAVAIGNSAGSLTQGIAAVAIGTLAGRTFQANNSIIINATGANLDQTTANTFTVAPVRNDVANTAEVMFYNATSKEVTYGNTISVAGNVTAGNVNTGVITLTNGAVIRDTAGDAVAIGQQAGETSQGNYAVAMGFQAAITSQGIGAVAIGREAGNAQGAYAVAIGQEAGFAGQSSGAIAIGLEAGNNDQGGDSVAIGYRAGGENQDIYAVAIGYQAGNNTQGGSAVAIGEMAGTDTQGVSAVAVGDGAGRITQGEYAVALGYGAGDTNQGNNSIIINATGGILNQTTANTFTVAPIRNDVANVAEVVFYNTTSKEITYGNAISVTGNISGGNIITAGNITGNTAGFAIGYRDIPQVSFTGNATIATTDAGKHFYSTQSTDYVLTIANNASQGFQTGAAITVVNQGTGNITVAQGSGVSLYLAGNATSGNRTVATFGMATIMKVATDTWFINGTGVS